MPNIGRIHLKFFTSFFIFLVIDVFLITPCVSQGTIIDHTCTDITQIPESAINQAKATLHIAYGHTSHGSQLTTGMTGLVGFANNGGLGLDLAEDIFAWNNGGTGGALDLHDYAMSGDCGYYPQWVDNTRSYLGDPDPVTGRGTSHSDVNVIIWSWCGQVSSRTEQTMIDTYLDPMSELEEDYPNIQFVYMTGHADGTGETENLHLRNQQIRNYCIDNDKILYDFYDIECYDPDGVYYGDKLVNDNCDYDSDDNGYRDRNWATDWQGSHTENVDWYNCSSAHSQPLNANRKAYGAWWLWAVLGGWDDESLGVQMAQFSAVSISQGILLAWRTESETDCAGFHVWRSVSEESGYERISTVMIPGNGNVSLAHQYQYIDRYVSEGIDTWYKIEEISTNRSSQFYGPVCLQWVLQEPGPFVLDQNHPNPFNASTTISFTLHAKGTVRLDIYDATGQLVRNLIDREMGAGNHRIFWDGMDMHSRTVSSGIYFYGLFHSSGYKEVKRMLLLK